MKTNRKILELKEFDYIFAGNGESNKLHSLDKESFGELEDLIYEFADKNEDIYKYLTISTKRNVGKEIHVKNYVGLIQLPNGTQIQILPKIYLTDNQNENDKIKRIFLKMLKSLKDFKQINEFTSARLDISRFNIYEIFIRMFLIELSSLVKHGLKSAYVKKEKNLNCFKGKLLVNKHIQNNFCHKERAYMLYDEFSANRPENRLIKSTLEKLRKVTTLYENSKQICNFLNDFDSVDLSTNYENDFSKTVTDKNTKEYANLIQWAKVFLMNKSFTTFSGKNGAKALLFPMEKIYESYVAQQIRRNLNPDWQISCQDKTHKLFGKFNLIPDIILRNDDRTIILDTKWKNLINDKSKNYGISQGDMYQMFAYAKKYNAKEVWLLYPLNAETINIQPEIYKDGDIYVNIAFVDLSEEDKENYFKDLTKSIIKED